MPGLEKAKKNLIIKIDDLFGFNLSNRQDGVSYDFGQYRLNKLYKPLVKYFIDQYLDHLKDYSPQDVEKILGLFTDFFALYYSNGDFGYFKNKFSSYEYRIPYSGKDTEFWRATKDCYYVKTSDVVNDMAVNLGGLLEDREVQLKMFKKTEPRILESGEERFDFDIIIEDILDEETEEFGGYKITFVNYEEAKGTKRQKENLISEILSEKGIDYGNPAVKKSIDEFLKKRGRDYFIHKRLKAFLTEELERYFFQMLKTDLQSKVDILQIQGKIEEIRLKYADDPEVIEFKIGQLMKEAQTEKELSVYEVAYLWILNFINILADLEEFKAKLWNKKRKVVKQDYCITVGKIMEYESLIPARKQILAEIFENEGQMTERKDLLESGQKHLEKISFEGIQEELKSGMINMLTNMVVDTKHFARESKLYQTLSDRGEKKLYEEGAKLDGILIKSENYQGLKVLLDKYQGKVQGVYIDPPFNLGENGDFLYKTDYLDGSWATLLNDRYTLAKNLIDETGSIRTRCDHNGNYIVKNLMDKVFGNENQKNEIILSKSNRIKTKGKRFLSRHDTLFFYATNILQNKFTHIKLKREEPGRRQMDNDGVVRAKVPIKIISKLSPENIRYDSNGNPTSRARIILGREILPPNGRRFPSQEQIREMEAQGNIRLSKNGNPQIPKSDDIFLTDNWTDVIGYSTSTGFPTENAEIILYRSISSSSNKNDIFLDYFAGSATTQAVAHKLGRRRIGIEIGQQFEDFDIPRLKNVLEGKQSGISREKDVDYKGGGMFSYLYLNQYEDRFNAGGYLDQIEGDMTEFSNIDVATITDIKQILFPLSELKETIYGLDD